MMRAANSSAAGVNPQPPDEPALRLPSTSEDACERAVMYWEIHENTLPYPIFPTGVIIDPRTEPERDTSISLLDTMGSFRSAVFVKGQEIGKPAEWRLGMHYEQNVETNTQDFYLTLSCVNLLVHPNVPVFARATYEFRNEEGDIKKQGGRLETQDLVPFTTGSRNDFYVGSKRDLQLQRNELVDKGVIRIQMVVNIYKDLAPPSTSAHQRSEAQQEPSPKRRRLECSSSIGDLVGILGSLEGLWANRERNGDVIIKCGDRDEILKAHRFILTGKSEVFTNMLNNKSNMRETLLNEITIHDITPEIMIHFLEFLYLNDSDSFDWTNVDKLCALIYAADKYLVAPLKTKCFQHLMEIMNTQNFYKIAKAAFYYNAENQFKNDVRHFFESNQISLNKLDSFQRFAYDDFEEFYKLLFYQIQ